MKLSKADGRAQVIYLHLPLPCSQLPVSQKQYPYTLHPKKTYPYYFGTSCLSSGWLRVVAQNNSVL